MTQLQRLAVAGATALRVAEVPTRAAIYTRVSEDRSQRERSPEEQEHGARRDAEMYGLEVVGTYRDLIGASRFTTVKVRPDWNRLQADIAAGAFQVLVSYGVDRGSRQTRQWDDMITLCRDNDVLLLLDGRTYDLQNPKDVARLKHEAVDAELEVEVTRMRVMRALSANLEAGLPHGKNLWGYQRTYNSAGKLSSVQPHPELGRVVREVFERYDQGETLFAICRDLDARGIQAPAGACPPDCMRKTTKAGKPHKHRTGTWGLQAGATKLRQTLRNPSYLGHRTNGKNEVQRRDVWEPLVDQALFDRVQHRLQLASRNRHNLTQGTAVAHLLSGLMTCGVCGGTVSYTTVGRNAPNRQPIAVYRCKTAGHVGRKAEWCEQAVVRAVLLRCEKDDLVAEWNKGNGKRLTAVTKELLALTTRYEKNKALWLDGRLLETTFAEHEADVVPRIQQLQREQGQLNAGVPIEVQRIAGPGAEARWAKATLDEQRAAIRALVQLRVVAKGGGSPNRKVGIEASWHTSDGATEWEAL